MSGHSRWSPGDRRLFNDESMRQFVDGYILALEDLLKDLAKFREGVVGEPGKRPPPGLGYWDGQVMVCKQVERSVGWSLSSARRTLESIQKKMDEG